MRNIEFNKSKGDEHRVLCPECEVEIRHIVIQSAEIDGSAEYDETFSIQWESKHQILECQGCQAISYREESSNSENYDPRTGRPDHSRQANRLTV
jgi:Zn-finger nucleic acid-binding protein